MRSVAILGWIFGLVLGVAASVAIWLSAPLPDINLRFAASIAPLVAWALVTMAMFRNRSPQSEGPPASMRDDVKAVVAFLARRGFMSARSRNSLPLYLVVGPPGSGKSSLLEQSGLKLGKPQQVGPITWWASKAAIFAEISILSDHRGVAPALALIKAVRPDLPVNGVILVVSPADLTLADAEEITAINEGLVQAMRATDEMMSASVPVYIMLTRIDLWPGFREFFDRQEPQERWQPWGFAFSHGPDFRPIPGTLWKDEMEQGFLEILTALKSRQIQLLSRETTPVRCAHIQNFPAQIAAMQRTLQPVLDAQMPEPGGSWQGAALRGMFLTSARQESLAIDALLPDMSRRFAMPRSGMLPPDLGIDDGDEGYFIAGAFDKAILPEAGLVIRTRRRRYGPIVQWMGIVLCLPLIAAMGWLVIDAFNINANRVAAYHEAVTGLTPVKIRQSRADLPGLLTQLDRLDQAARQLAAGTAMPQLDPWLDQSSALVKISDNTDKIRTRALLPHLAAMLEESLVDKSATASTLKGRIALARSARDPESPLLKMWLAGQARQIIATNPALFVDQSLAAIRKAGGLTVDVAYLDAAVRLVAYKDSQQ